MNYKFLGRNTGLPIGEFALGTAMFGETWDYATQTKEAGRIIDLFVEHGGNLLDTADTYQSGESEVVLGKVIGSKRNDLVITTKFTRGVLQGQGLGSLGNHRKNMVQSVEASLKRLNTDRIDLFFVHQDDFFTPMEEIVRGLDDLVRAGKIVYGGLSNFPAWRVSSSSTMADLRGWSAIAAIEVEYSLLQRDTERELLPMADALGLGVLAWSPLAGGLLTGKYRKGESGRATLIPGGIPYHAESTTDALLDELFSVADSIDSKPELVAIAWLREKGVVPVLGVRTFEQLENNLKVSEVKLTSEHMQKLDDAGAFKLGYPHDFNASVENRDVLTGGKGDRIQKPNHIVG
ncbi:aldo/keto reductase (plasmid) [Mucilaginibacter sp. PAMB04274]|uniref:aldo/keto reductase n=1 Tax=Mucilaginibacter sp. PAMB04274 TaxID=3138568 RepID=UPI0031F7110E